MFSEAINFESCKKGQKRIYFRCESLPEWIVTFDSVITLGVGLEGDRAGVNATFASLEDASEDNILS